MNKRSLIGLYYRVKYYHRFTGWSFDFEPCVNSKITIQFYEESTKTSKDIYELTGCKPND